MIEKTIYVYIHDIIHYIIHYIIHDIIHYNYMPMNLMDLKLLKKKWTRRE